MKKIFSVICLFLACIATTKSQENTSNEITARLIEDGFENVRVAKHGNNIHATIEDNHYRGIFRGLAIALQKISPDAAASDTIEMIVLSDQMPKLTVNAIHSEGMWNIDTYHGGTLGPELRSIKAKNKSRYKADIVLYPSVALSNNRYDRIWSAAFMLSPTIEMQLWKGSKIALQCKTPIWSNFHNTEYNNVSPGYISLTQQFISNKSFNVNSSLGIFNHYRTGLKANATWHALPNLDLGITTSYTGPWYYEDNKINLCQWDKFNILGIVDYYEHYSNLQAKLSVGQFLLGDFGGQLDIIRHYQDYKIGGFVSLTNWGTNVGFEFCIPFCTKKMGKHRTVRLRTSDSFYFGFYDNSNVKKDKNSKDIANTFNGYPGENHNINYWQPLFIKKYIQMYLDGNIK